MNSLKKFKCCYCNLSYDHTGSMRRHLSKVHMEKKVDMKDTFKNNCTLCDKKFKFKKTLRRHERLNHGINTAKNVNGFTCSLCKFSTSVKTDFFKHIETTHDFPIKTEEHTFLTKDEFNQWKEKVENETFSKYIKKCGDYNGADNSRRYYYDCHRSGFFAPIKQSKKNLKAKGSKKINGTCPSSIQLYEAKDGVCKVKFIPTHVGHKNEIFHMDLSEAEKKSLAKDILNKVPFDEILNKVRESATDPLKRIHLLTKKDLYNIRRTLNVASTAVQHSDVDDYDNEIIIEECFEEVNACEDPGVQLCCEITTDVEPLSSNTVGSTEGENTLCIDIENENQPDGVQGSSNILTAKISEDLRVGFTAKIEKMKNQYLSLLDSVQSEKELEILEKNFNELEGIMNAARSNPYIVQTFSLNCA